MLQNNSVDVFLGQGGAAYAKPFAIGAETDSTGILVENLHGQSPMAGVPDIVVPSVYGVMVLLNLTK